MPSYLISVPTAPPRLDLGAAVTALRATQPGWRLSVRFPHLWTLEAEASLQDVQAQLPAGFTAWKVGYLEVKPPSLNLARAQAVLNRVRPAGTE